jgi:hypothetical protein
MVPWPAACIVQVGGIMNTLKVMSGLAVATLAACVLFNLKDIRRYIKISTM